MCNKCHLTHLNRVVSWMSRVGDRSVRPSQLLIVVTSIKRKVKIYMTQAIMQQDVAIAMCDKEIYSLPEPPSGCATTTNDTTLITIFAASQIASK